MIGADRRASVVMLALVLAAGIFLLDISTPQEIPPQYLYALCVLLAVQAQHERTIWWMAALGSGLTLLGSYLSPPSFAWAVIIFNRTTAILLIWSTAVLAWQYRRTHDRLRRLNEELEARVEDRTRDLSHAFVEREELNRNLHDEVLQSLYAIGLHLESSGRSQQYGSIDPEGPRVRTLQQLTLVMQKIRSYIGGQPAPETLPFDQSLSNLVRDMTPIDGPRFSVEIEKGLTYCIPTAQVEPLLLIVREAISNCIRHANARRGTVTARCYNGIMRIEIKDDGIGFDPAAKPGGHGLANMAARAQQIGAAYHLEAAPGQGVRVVIELPLEKEATVGERR